MESWDGKEIIFFSILEEEMAPIRIRKKEIKYIVAVNWKFRDLQRRHSRSTTREKTRLTAISISPASFALVSTN